MIVYKIKGKTKKLIRTKEVPVNRKGKHGQNGNFFLPTTNR